MKDSFALAVALGTILLFALPKQANGQGVDLQSQTADLAARKTALLNESTDFEETMKSLQVTEFETALSINNTAQQAVMGLDATVWFLTVYNNMQCDPDRAVAKGILTNRLGLYAHLLDIEAGQVAGWLAFAKLPVTAQTGLKIKDDLRAAKGKLDDLVALLN
jgi:hypothetical protein